MMENMMSPPGRSSKRYETGEVDGDPDAGGDADCERTTGTKEEGKGDGDGTMAEELGCVPGVTSSRK